MMRSKWLATKIMRIFSLPQMGKRMDIMIRTGVLFIMMIFCGTACTRQPSGHEIVPNLLGLSLDHAIYYLEQYELSYSVDKRPVEDESRDGIVLEQHPSPGESIEPDLIISLVAGKMTGIDAEKSALSVEKTPDTDGAIPTATHTPQPMAMIEPLESVTPTIASPTPVGGGNGQIVFASDRSGTFQLWLTDGNGEEAGQLTAIEGGACEPDWSPDGSMIVFTSPCDGRHDQYPGSSLWLVSAGGGDERMLAGMAGADFNPVWSPDGTKIAFTSTRDGGISQIYLYDVALQTAENLSNNSANEFQPDWSPDGATIAFISPSPGSNTVMLKDVADRKSSQFTRDTERNYAFPLWSPDGERLVFSLVPDGGVPSLMSARLQEQGFVTEKILTGFPMPIRGVSLSPDGKWAVYESWLDGANHDIWMQSMDGVQQVRITNEKSYDFDPDWRPDISIPDV